MKCKHDAEQLLGVMFIIRQWQYFPKRSSLILCKQADRKASLQISFAPNLMYFADFVIFRWNMTICMCDELEERQNNPSNWPQIYVVCIFQFQKEFLILWGNWKRERILMFSVTFISPSNMTEKIWFYHILLSI